MAADDEQAIPRRRSRNLNYDPYPIVNSPDRDAITRDDSYYSFDEGLDDTNRSNTSVVRLNQPTGPYSSRATGEPNSISKRRRPTNGSSQTVSSPRQTTGNLPKRDTTGGLVKRQTQSDPLDLRQTTGGLERRQAVANRQTRDTDSILNSGSRQLRNTPPQLSSSYNKPPKKHQEENESRKIHWLVPAGVGMFAMLVLFILGSSVLSWATLQYNNLEYGMPRTYQTDAVVGHGGDSTVHPSHFIAMNLNHQAIVIEMMASNPAKSVTYVVANIVGDNSSLAPVTLQFRDVNNDKKPDMIVYVHLNGQEQVSVFINDGTKFRPANSTDKIKY